MAEWGAKEKKSICIVLQINLLAYIFPKFEKGMSEPPLTLLSQSSVLRELWEHYILLPCLGFLPVENERRGPPTTYTNVVRHSQDMHLVPRTAHSSYPLICTDSTVKGDNSGQRTVEKLFLQFFLRNWHILLLWNYFCWKLRPLKITKRILPSLMLLFTW